MPLLVLCAEADFCVTLGGDGTVLHLTSLFAADKPLPPVVAFAMGTLGKLATVPRKTLNPSAMETLGELCSVSPNTFLNRVFAHEIVW